MTEATYRTYRVVKSGVIKIQEHRIIIEENDIIKLPPGVGTKYMNLGYLIPEDPKAVKITGVKPPDQKSYKVG